MFFIKRYKSKKIKSTNIYKNRKYISTSKNPNLLYLLNKRFFWMKNYLKVKKILFKIGSGNGCLKKVITNNKIVIIAQRK